MRGMGIFYYSSKDADGKKVNLPKQEYKDHGYFVTKEEPYNKGDKDCLYTKIYVTGKGELWLANKLGAETAEAFMEKGEAEYQKIIDKTSMNYIEKAIENCPPSNNTILDKKYSFEEVAKIIGESQITVMNFCKAKGWLNDQYKPYSHENKYFTSDGSFTEDGKNYVVAAFFNINKAEKGMRKTSLGLGE